MTSRINSLFLSSIALPQSLKQSHRVTILFGAVLLAAVASFLAARSLIHRAHVRSIGTLSAQGKQNFAERKYAEAIQNYKEALRHSPTERLRKEIEAKLAESTLQNYLHIARQNHVTGNLDVALKNFKAALDLHPTDVKILTEIYSSIGAIHLAQQHYQLAKDNYKKALVYTPTDLTVLEALATLEQKLQPKPKQSSQSLPVEKDKHPVKKPTNLAQEYYEKGLQTLDSADEAIKHFSTALACQPDKELKGQVLYQLGVSYRKKQQYDLALLHFMGGLFCTSGQKLYAVISLERGFLQDIHQQNLEGAIESYQVVIDLTHDKGINHDPKLQAIALFLKGNAVLRQEYPNDVRRSRACSEALHSTILALDYARKIESLDNQLLIELHYQKGLCYQGLEQFDNAINGYEDALKLVKNPYTKASILCDLALCYRQAARTSEAVEPYDEASKCGFTDENLEENLEFLGGAPLKVLKRGASASLENSADLKSMIEESKISIGKITGID